MTAPQVAVAAVIAVFSVNLLLLVSLVGLKMVHRRRITGHDKRRAAYVGLLSRHLTFDHHTDPITERMANDEAFLDAVIDLRNTVAGPEVEKLAQLSNRYGLVDRQTSRLLARFPLGRRLRAAVSLAELGDESSAHVLMDHLDDREDEIRIQCARGLGRMRWTPAIDLIVDRLGQENAWVRTRFADTLIGFGKQASWPLMAYIRVNHIGGDTKAVTEAIRVLGTIGDLDIGPQLADIRDLTDNVEIEIAAVAALGTVGGPLALPSLVDAFYSSDWRVRAKAATALGDVGDPECVEDLQSGLLDQTWWVRRNSAAALAKVPGGIDLLYTILSSDDPFARDAAGEALEGVGELARASAHHVDGTATRDQVRLLRHMRGQVVVTT